MPHTTKAAVLKPLEQIFPTEPTFVTDSEELREYLSSCNLKTQLVSNNSKIETAPENLENVVYLFTTFDYISWPFLERSFGKSRLLLIPLASFDPSLQAAIYTLDTIGHADFASSTRENETILNYLSQVTQPFRVSGAGCELVCELSEKIRLMKPKTEAALLRGEWEALGMWFETAILPDEENIFHPGHIVTGTFEATGAAVARHMQMPLVLTPTHRDAWALITQLHEERLFPLKVEIERSRIVDVKTATGESIRKELVQLTNERYDLALLEVAFSGNSKLSSDTLDWRINSVVNEGARGMHIGIGDGITGAHIDLIAPNALIEDF
ncbi:hypothetical protein [Deinococcus sp. QL22]|uniref:hypothetical protein n=1 Tax=Deinococcus sp. QL22 TaxID=2939437 RepID=UPI0020173159|nr:hypothetical protein [Deinococcus sp. QL22]UQN07975.1 hypothetical protein M1R55_17915 [Deinococcus sp. QL22]